MPCCAMLRPELIPQRTSCQMKCQRADMATNSLDHPPYRIHNWLTPTENTATIDWKTMSCTASEEHSSSNGAARTLLRLMGG